MSEETIKMPEPIIEPDTKSVASKRDNFFFIIKCSYKKGKVFTLPFQL
jgi:hypothetical protein